MSLDIENFRARSVAFEARARELRAGAAREATARRWVTVAAYAMTAGVLAAGWPATPSWLVAAVGVWVATKAVGGVIVGVWAQREIDRIMAAHPMPPEEGA